MAEAHGRHDKVQRSIEWSEAVIGTPLFDDETYRQLAREAPHDLPAEKIGMRKAALSLAWRAVIRYVYEDRRQRQLPENDWALTPERAATIRERDGEFFAMLGRQILSINQLERTPPVSAHLTPREDQHTIIEKVISYIQAPPNMRAILRPEVPEAALATGIVCVSPTGTGKSVLEGTIIRRAGIGKVINQATGERLRALLVVPSRELVQAFAGDHGKRTFLRALGPDISVSAYYESQKDLEGDVVVSSIDSLKNALADGIINPRDFALTVIDEVHHLTAPQFTKTLQEQGLGPLVIGFTATPHYDPIKDARNMLPYTVQGESIVEYMRQGILNGAQLFSFRVDVEGLAKSTSDVKIVDLILNSKVTDYVIEAAKKFANEGKRVAIYCQKGRESIHAREIARRLREERKDGEPVVRARAVGVFQTDRENDEILQALDHHELDVVTTVDMLSEGWDADIDVVIIARRMRSLLKLQQIVGRGGRPNPDFPITTYIEFLPIIAGDEQDLRSIYECFGLQEVEQGLVIGEERGYRPKQARRKKSSRSLPPFDLRQLSPELQALAHKINHKLLRNVTVAVPMLEDEVEIPPDYLPLAALMQINPNYLSEAHLLRALERANIGWIGSWQQDGRHRILTHYFPPEAADYLREHPLPPLAEAGELTIPTIAERYGADPEMVRRIIERKGIEPIERNTQHGRFNHYRPADVLTIGEEIESVAEAEETDVRVADLHNTVGCSQASIYRSIGDYTTTYKRYEHSVTGRSLYATFVTQAEADRFWAEYHAIPTAKEGEMTITDMTYAARVTRPAIVTAMNEADKAQATLKWPQARSKPPREYYPAEVAAAIIERARMVQLPPHLISLRGMEGVLAAKRDTFRRLLEGRFEETPLRLGGRGGHELCYTWRALQFLQDHYGRRPGLDPINYAALPTGPEDGSAAKIAYALMLQQRLVKSNVQLLAEELLKKDGAEKPEQSTLYRELDAQSISDLTGRPIEAVRAALAANKPLGALPPKKRINEHGLITECYSERWLDDTVIALQGITATAMSERLGVPAETIKLILFSQHHIADRGRYGLTTWREAERIFRQPPKEYIALETIANPFKNDSQPTLGAFLRDNGGSIAYFYNSQGERGPYLSPFSAKLIDVQSKPYPQPSDQLNREEIARLTGQTPAAFDAWMWQQYELRRNIRWFTTRDGSKVLPHFERSLVMPYIKRYLPKSPRD